MEKSNLIKSISILLISAMLILWSTSVFADNTTEDWNDLTNTVSNNTTANNTANAAANLTANNTTAANSTANSTNALANTTSKTNNTSAYTNTNLPKTGIEDSIPVALLVAVFGISAVFAYKKVKEYRNI